MLGTNCFENRRKKNITKLKEFDGSDFVSSKRRKMRIYMSLNMLQNEMAKMKVCNI